MSQGVLLGCRRSALCLARIATTKPSRPALSSPSRGSEHNRRFGSFRRRISFLWNHRDRAERARLRRKFLHTTLVWPLTGVLYNDMNAARRRERIRRARMSTGAGLRFTTSCGVAVVQGYCEAFVGCLWLLLWVLPQEDVVFLWCR